MVSIQHNYTQNFMIFSHKYNFDWANKNEPSWHKIQLIMKCKNI